jgi:uncharacterized protein (TIGR00255 family)
MASAPLRGMTGFGRAQGQPAWGAWVWEARAVNGRGLDIRSSTPPGFDSLDFEARRRVKERFQRGSFQVQLRIDFARDAAAAPVDVRELARLSRLARTWRAPQPAIEGVLALGGPRSSSRSAQAVDEATAHMLLAGLDTALQALDEQRLQEGAALLELFHGILADMATQVAAAASHAAGQPDLVRDRFRQRLAEMARDAAVDADRAAQEIVLMAARADVREELDRLTAHIATARSILSSGGAAGRKLDFLCQEFNREANTLCSKSVSLELTNAGLALKSLIEQFREQAQNVE